MSVNLHIYSIFYLYVHRFIGCIYTGKDGVKYAKEFDVQDDRCNTNENIRLEHN